MARINPKSNRLIASLGERERNHFLDSSSLVRLALGQVLYKQGDRIRYYFPLTAFISLLTSLEDLSTIGVGMVGAEGVCGHMLVLGKTTSPVLALTRGEGTAWRIGALEMRRCLDKSPGLRGVIRSYLAVMFEQSFQTIACTRFHLIERRLARWLLMIADRAASLNRRRSETDPPASS